MKLEDATPSQLRTALTLALDQLTRIAYDKSTACSDAEKTIGEIEDLLASDALAARLHIAQEGLTAIRDSIDEDTEMASAYLRGMAADALRALADQSVADHAGPTQQAPERTGRKARQRCATCRSRHKGKPCDSGCPCWDDDEPFHVDPPAQSVAVPTGPVKRPCEWCADTGIAWSRNLADELVQRPCPGGCPRPLCDADGHVACCNCAPASRDSTPNFDVTGAPSPKLVEDMNRTRHLNQPQASRDSTRGTAMGPRESCKPGCRMVDEGMGGEMVKHHQSGCPNGPWTQFMRADKPMAQMVAETSALVERLGRERDARLAGPAAANPTPPSTRGTCERCRDTRWIGSPALGVQPCPDCAPQSDKLTQAEKNALSLLR